MKKPIEVRPTSPHTLKWWLARYSEIDTNPPYQREGRIWSDSDKAYLIDSMLNGFDIPKLYLADFTYGDSPLNKARLPYAIIDGKQRLEAIWDFYAGRVVLNDDFQLLDRPELNLAGLGYKDLKEGFSDIAERFDDYELSMMSVITQEEEHVNDLFVRLNRSKPLTGAEIRNAMKGPVPELIRLISANEFFNSYVRFKINRGDHKNVAAKVLAFEYYEQPQSTKKVDLDSFAQKLDIDQEKLERAAWQASDVFQRMTDIFLPKDRLLASSGLVPVYYWFIRSLPENQHRFVRQFLILFENERTANRTLVRQDPDSTAIDSKLLEYDQYNRSTNDLRSHRERVKILAGKFHLFMTKLAAMVLKHAAP
jgi:hypothetical protein